MDPAAHNTNLDVDRGTPAVLSPIGFSLETPSDGPAQAPSYTNFSPLFSSANLNGLPPVAPIALRANSGPNSAIPSVDGLPSFFPSFLDGSGQSGNSGFLMDQHSAANSMGQYTTWAAPVPIPFKAVAGLKRRRLDEFNSGMMSFAGDQPVDSSSVGYVGSAAIDSYPSGGFQVAFEAPLLASESISYYASAPVYSNQQQKVHQTPSPSEQARFEYQTSTPQAQQQPQQQQQYQPELPLTPESAIDAVLKKTSGSSCHQCKNRRESRHLNFCRNRTRGMSDDKKKKICRKKFCDHCIIKFNYQVRLPPKNSRDWECPSCLGICVCAACRRKNDLHHPTHVTALATATEISTPVSPTLSFAHKLFYNPDLMGQSQDLQGHLTESMPFFSSAF